MKNNKIDFRNAFFDEMYAISKKNNKIVFLTADISAYSLPKFKKDFPEKFYNVGIAEQGMVNIATGLAMNKKKVFIFSMIPFLTMRCFEHIKINICCLFLNNFILFFSSYATFLSSHINNNKNFIINI